MTDDFNRDRFRAELLLQLPDVASFVHRTELGQPTVTYGDPDYDRDALAAWILEQVDLAAATPDEQLGRVVELAGAASTLKASAEFARYCSQLAAVLRRGHTLASQTDLARTIEVEASRLTGIAAQLIAAYPSLLQVEAPDRALVVPGENG